MPKQYPYRKCLPPPKKKETNKTKTENKQIKKKRNKQKQNKIIFFDFKLILLDRITNYVLGPNS